MARAELRALLPAGFADEHLGRRPLHVRGALASLAPDDAIGWHTANRLLAMYRFVAPGTVDVGIMRNKGRTVPLVADRIDEIELEMKELAVRARVAARYYDPAALADAMHAGAAVVFNDAHTHDLELRRLCVAVEDLLGGRAFCNLYLTSARERFCAPHVDAHDLFVLHVAGEKTWRLHRFHAPGTERNLNPAQHPDFDAGPVEHELTLLPGDLLYVPWGKAHSVETRTSAMHLSVGHVPLKPSRSHGGRVPRYEFQLPLELD